MVQMVAYPLKMGLQLLRKRLVDIHCADGTCHGVELGQTLVRIQVLAKIRCAFWPLERFCAKNVPSQCHINREHIVEKTTNNCWYLYHTLPTSNNHPIPSTVSSILFLVISSVGNKGHQQCGIPSYRSIRVLMPHSSLSTLS